MQNAASSAMTAPALDLTQRPRSTGGTLRGILVGLFLLPWTTFWGSWALVFGLLRLSSIASGGINLWSRGIVFLCGVRIRTHGVEHMKDARPCVFLCNHQSALDIPILISACRAHHEVRFLAKESLFKIPFLGWGMSATGFVPIRRESAKHSAQVFQKLLHGIPVHVVMNNQVGLYGALGEAANQLR